MRPTYVALLLFAVTALTRLPFRSEFLYHWDSANFALALDRFDPTQHQPQPPGYLYYVGVAWLLRAIFTDANQALVLEGIVLSGLAVAAVFLLGRKLFDATTGLTAAVLLASSVTYWTYGEIAFPYVGLACFASALGWAAWSGQRPLVATAIYAVAGGFRQDLLVFLGPMWLFSLRTSGRRKAALSVVFAALGVLAWYLPTVYLSGGIEAYQTALSAQSLAVADQFSIAGHGLAALANNVGDLTRYVLYAWYAQIILLVPAGLWLLIELRRRPTMLRSDRAVFFALWVFPVLLFYAFVHIGDAGYVFTFLPALELLLAAALVWLVTSMPVRLPRVLVWLLPAFVVVNTAVFLFHDRQLTVRGIRAQDALLRDTIGYVRDHYPNGSAVLLASSSYRHMVYYLPEYQAFWVNSESPKSYGIQVPPSTTAVVLVDHDLDPLVTGSVERVPLDDGVTLNVLPATAGQWLTFGGTSVYLHE